MPTAGGGAESPAAGVWDLKPQPYLMHRGSQPVEPLAVEPQVIRVGKTYKSPVPAYAGGDVMPLEKDGLMQPKRAAYP